MTPKPVFQAGLLACAVMAMVACHSTQSTSYTKSEKSAVAAKPQTIQLPNVSQELQVEVVTEEPADKNKKKANN